MCSSSASAFSEMLCGFMCWFMASPFCAQVVRTFLRDGFDGVNDRLIAGAPAVVSRNVLADHITAGDTAARQKFLRGEQHAGCAKAALQRVAAAESVLQVRDGAGVGHTLDGLDPRAIALHRQRQAAAQDRVVHPHGASAAHAVLAADMAAGEAERLAQEIDECEARLDGFGNGFAIHRETDIYGAAHARGSASCFATRRSSTPARCFFTAPVAWISSGGSRSSAATASSTEPAANAASALWTRTG